MVKKTLIIICFLCPFFISQVIAEEKEANDEIEKMAMFKKTEALTFIPWYYLAAINQYEKNIKKEASNDNLIAIEFPNEQWYGLGNLDQIKDATFIQLYNGIGQDGNGDGKADPANDEDTLATMAHWILQWGTSEQDIKIALWNFYQRAINVQTIEEIAKIYKTFGTIELDDNDFPIPLQHNYSYRSTWGDARGFGGRRIHEGTDIFANYGTPVKATRYGVVEIVGWNRFGGWRIGIRDIYNTYHYFAHLNGFKDGLKVGDIVKPGDVIGSVGASGYGPPGTSGKFPPHLHYGMYKDNGYSEWAFDPYSHLKRWESQARN